MGGGVHAAAPRRTDPDACAGVAGQPLAVPLPSSVQESDRPRARGVPATPAPASGSPPHRTDVSDGQGSDGARWVQRPQSLLTRLQEIPWRAAERTSRTGRHDIIAGLAGLIVGNADVQADPPIPRT